MPIDLIQITLYNVAGVDCGDPGSVEGTYKLGPGFKWQDVMNFTCKNGFEVKSGRPWSTVKCEANATWSGSLPVCQRECLSRL